MKKQTKPKRLSNGLRAVKYYGEKSSRKEGGELGSGEVFIKVVRAGLAEKGKFEEDLRGMKNPTTWTSGESVIQEEGAARPTQKHAWYS